MKLLDGHLSGFAEGQMSQQNCGAECQSIHVLSADSVNLALLGLQKKQNCLIHFLRLQGGLVLVKIRKQLHAMVAQLVAYRFIVSSIHRVLLYSK